MRAVNAVQRVAEVHGARTEWVVRSAFHALWQVRLALAHFCRRMPDRPFSLARDVLDAAPLEALTADADAEAHCLAARLDEVEILAAGIDDNRSGLLVCLVLDFLGQELGVHLP